MLDQLALEVVPLPRGLGVEITGVDLRRLDAAEFDRIRTAFHRNGLILVRDQTLTPDELSRFVGRFGELERHTLQQYTLPGHPEIYVLANIEEDGRQIGAHNEGIGWHTDLSYKAKPVMATALYGVICPPEGADTLFADMTAAYDALPEERKRQLDGLRIHHSYHRFMASRDDRAPLTEEQKAATPDVSHPLVRTHPETGRRSLYIGTGTVFAIEGMANPAGKDLVDELVEYATEERFVSGHKWREGDFLMWDNRCTLHTGTLFDDVRYKRRMHRLMVKGDVPR